MIKTKKRELKHLSSIPKKSNERTLVMVIEIVQKNPYYKRFCYFLLKN